MIVKNEEAIIERCLTSLECLRPALAQVCIYDTGSTDATVQIARSLGATVHDGYWDDDFSRARNESLAMASTPWVATIDADETIWADPHALAQFLTHYRNKATAAKVSITNVDPLKRAMSEHRFPKIMQRKKVQFARRLHEVPRMKGTLAALDMVEMPTTIFRIHHHWIPGETRAAKGRRNSAIAIEDLQVTQAGFAAVPQQRSEGEAELAEVEQLYEQPEQPVDQPPPAEDAYDPTTAPIPDTLSRRDAIELARNLFEWGRAQHSAMNLPAAMRGYRKALEVPETGPFGELATEYLIRTLIDLQQFDEALQKVQFMRETYAHRDFFDWLEAEIYMKTQRYEQALPLLRGIKTLISSFGVETDAALVVEARMLAAAHCGEIDEALANGLQLMTHSGRGAGYGNLILVLWGKRPVEQLALLIDGLDRRHRQFVIEEFAKSRDPGPQLSQLLLASTHVA